jgi:hypothetical protein
MLGQVSTCPVRGLPLGEASRPVRWGLGFAIMLALAACGNKRTQLTQDELENGVRSTPAATKGAPPSGDPRCPLGERVTAPAEGSPEWVIQELYTAAAAQGDDEANFQRFYKHFDPTSTAENWARTQYWGRVRKHVAKYLDNPGGTPAHFTICERRNEGPETFRISVRSNDPAKMNPPITVKRDPATGRNMVIFFSY